MDGTRSPGDKGGTTRCASLAGTLADLRAWSDELPFTPFGERLRAAVHDLADELLREECGAGVAS